VTLARTVSRAMGCRDPYTAGHQRRVASMSRMIGEKMGMQEDRLQGLYIGKLSVPEGLLSKPGRLLDEEMGLIRLHVKQGFEILREADLPWPVADMALHHHERLDGSGYPEGLGAEQISLENRILAVCDVVEAMCSHRPYRPARSMEEVIRELEAGRGSRYDPDVVDLMLDAIAKGELERLRDPLATVNGAPPG